MRFMAIPRFLFAVVGVLCGFATNALAGPPLICHAIEIGQAKSLPPIDWNSSGTGGYALKNLSRDTLAILDSDASVLVRMETLRRATIYARHDPATARELLLKLRARADGSEAAGHPDALSWFDVGYLAEAYQQWMGKNDANPAAGLDGYAWIRRAIRLRGEDAEMEFAAALVTLNGPENAHREHVQKATAGTRNDALLAQNLASRFYRQTVSEALSQPTSKEAVR
jgi:hypothetical protein